MAVKEYNLVIPEGYEKRELPYFNEWIAALESGDYEQHLGKLCWDGKTYCCLGLLSKIQGRLTPTLRDGSSTNCPYALAEDNPCYPSLNQAGAFDSGVQCWVDDFPLYSLAGCNDYGLHFKQIAEIIKALWKPSTTN
jgi:hypothetical protein